MHSHGDRSFLDDRILALISGDLRAAGIDNDLVAAVLREGEALSNLARALEDYDVIVVERVWSRELVTTLRSMLQGRIFVSCDGEHALDDPPAEYVCRGDLRASVPALVKYLAADANGALPRGVWVREDGHFREGLGRAEIGSRAFSPNLRPIWVGEPPAVRTFSIEGNAGCPYRADARENPLYAGTEIPDGIGRGCAFCTTGNHSESAPAEQTVLKVLEQIRFVRAHAPELGLLVLKDQNPFGYLPELVAQCEEHGLTGFSLLLETRADWFLRNEVRFERALLAAERAQLRICPFLVGIENFSQPELDRFNKGTTAETNELFLARLRSWQGRYRSFDLRHASFGFVLLTPWTTMEDLRTNLDAVERTAFDALRGHLLVSRARLYRDTALYYLAERDGLLERKHAPSADSSRRYGYYPAAPWRFLDERVGRFAALAAELTERFSGRDQVLIWRALLSALEQDAGASLDDVLKRLNRYDSVRARFARLVAPLSADRPFSDGWRFGDLVLRQDRVSLRLLHEHEDALHIEIALRNGEANAFARSGHYDIRHLEPELTDSQQRALRALAGVIVQNDPPRSH